jgi:diketogulonate reductase-like aldo/keto reductase
MPLDRSSTLPLENGAVPRAAMPRLGLGVWQSGPGSGTRDAVAAALEAGVRLIDTAAAYGNEREVGEAVRASGLPRSDVFVTTKLWNEDQGYEPALRAFSRSRDALDLGVVDLYLLHWPVPGKRLDSWRALERLLAEGGCRAIGVSNFTERHLRELFAASGTRPAVNQVELHPFLPQRRLRAFCREHGIVVEAYSPLARAERLDDRRVRRIAERHGRSPAQVLVRWGLQQDVVVIPKSARRRRIAENADVFDFELDEADLAELAQLEDGFRTCWDPSRID